MRSSPKASCSSPGSRSAAFELLLELANPHLEFICEELVQFHTRGGDSSLNWGYLPQLEPRASSDFVGLKNAGATCYMNAVLQQMYMNPGIRSAILSLDDDDEMRCQRITRAKVRR